MFSLRRFLFQNQPARGIHLSNDPIVTSALNEELALSLVLLRDKRSESVSSEDVLPSGPELHDIKNPPENSRGKSAYHAQALPSLFYHPDYTVGSGITPDHALHARGLYRRWGISPRPEDTFQLFILYFLIHMIASSIVFHAQNKMSHNPRPHGSPCR